MSNGKPRAAGPTDSSDSANVFLDLEAERAKEAILESLRQAKEAFGEVIDPRQLTKKHPLLSVTSAIVAGFAAAVVAIPSREQQELRRVERLRRAMDPKPTVKADSNGAAAEAKGPWWMSIVHEVIQLARPLLTAAITAQMTKKAVDEKADTSRVQSL